MPKKNTAKKNVSKKVKKINLALQGGGTHGAFTWGVLDRILKDDGITIDGISGTSAGAINGALFCCGMANGGKDEARELLDSFWKEVAMKAIFSPFQPTFIDKMMGNRDFTFSPAYYAMEAMSRIFSPSQLNYFDINPLRDVLEKFIDFKILGKNDPIKFFVNMTNVLNGKPRIMSGEEICLEALLASACLPFIFKAVEIDGVPYWDGGYSGNPSIYPLIYNCNSEDCLIIQINPINIHQVPETVPDILDRTNEISFNASLMHEMRAIAFVQRLIAQGRLEHEDYKYLRIHMIEAEDIMEGLGNASKVNADIDFLEHLKETGYQTADEWLAKNHGKIGVESTLDIRKTFL